LAVVGTDFGNRAQQAIRKSGLEGRIDLLGAVTLEQLNAMLCGSEALVVASQEEGFCLPALEAMALGVPVISTPLPSVIEICGAAAWYAPGFGADAIAESLRRFFQNRAALAEHNIRLGLTRARAFDRVRAARETLAVYREVLGERAQSWQPVEGSLAVEQRISQQPLKWQSATEEIRRVVGQV
jgi:glycosyltransferase involved in cell wall biosynthesis